MSNVQTFKFKLPIPSMKPLNARLFVHLVKADDLTTESGLIVPSSHLRTTDKGALKTVTRDRFIVIAVADDLHIGARYLWGIKIRKSPIVRGTEVYTFLPMEAESYTLPQVIDNVNAGARYEVIHESELSGYDNTVVNEIRKRKRWRWFRWLFKRSK
jgi:hypothetical protein